MDIIDQVRITIFGEPSRSTPRYRTHIAKEHHVRPTQERNPPKPELRAAEPPQGAIVAGGLAAAGAGGIGIAQAQSFTHPGLLLPADGLDRMRGAVQANREPWIGGWTEGSLAAGIYGYQAANAAEIVRDESGFDRGRFQTMLDEVFYPQNNDFLVRHHDTCDGHYWANWDLCNMAAILAIGVFNDDQAKFDQAIEYFWNGIGQGSIEHVIPFIHGDLAQWQESGRDQAHSLMGIGLMAEFMEMAWSQGIDLYSARDSAFAKAAEYVARYNNGYDVPFTRYSNCDGIEHTVIADGARGQVRPVWELVYSHYNGRLGRAMPNVSEMLGTVRPEGGGGDYATTSGGYDSLGFGTLAYTRDEAAPVDYNRLQSYNFTDRYVRHINYELKLEPIDDAVGREDATFRITA